MNDTMKRAPDDDPSEEAWRVICSPDLAESARHEAFEKMLWLDEGWWGKGSLLRFVSTHALVISRRILGRYRFSADQVDWEALGTDALLLLFKRAKTIEHQPKAWLIGVISNLVRQEARMNWWHMSTRLLLPTILDERPVTEFVDDVASSTSERRRQDLLDLFGDLDPSLSAVAQLLSNGDLTRVEICDTLGISSVALRKRIERLRRAFKCELVSRQVLSSSGKIVTRTLATSDDSNAYREVGHKTQPTAGQATSSAGLPTVRPLSVPTSFGSRPTGRETTSVTPLQRAVAFSSSRSNDVHPTMTVLVFGDMAQATGSGTKHVLHCNWNRKPSVAPSNGPAAREFISGFWDRFLVNGRTSARSTRPRTGEEAERPWRHSGCYYEEQPVIRFSCDGLTSPGRGFCSGLSNAVRVTSHQGHAPCAGLFFIAGAFSESPVDVEWYRHGIELPSKAGLLPDRCVEQDSLDIFYPSVRWVELSTRGSGDPAPTCERRASNRSVSLPTLVLCNLVALLKWDPLDHAPTRIAVIRARSTGVQSEPLAPQVWREVVAPRPVCEAPNRHCDGTPGPTTSRCRSSFIPQINGIARANLKTTSSLFEASIDLRLPGQALQHWHIQQDSLIWKE